jgi:cysteinyl-tRNA synthetase
MEGWANLAKITPAATSTIDVKELRAKCYEAMNDDLSTPIVISHLFDGVRIINTVLAGNATLSQDDLDELRETMRLFMFDVLGLVESKQADESGNEAYAKAVELLLEMRRDAKARKDWAMSDLIRDRLGEIGFELKDTKDGTEWKLK